MGFLLRRATRHDAEAVAAIYVESWNVGFAGLMPLRALDHKEVARWQNDLGQGELNELRSDRS